MNGDARYIVLLGLSSPADAVLCESCVWDNRHVTYVADSILGWRKTADPPVEGANRHRSRRAILRATAAVIAPSGRRMVSTERTLVPGCRVQPLGVMRYVPVASQTFIEQHLPDGFTAHAVMKAPSLAWNQDDALQDMMVRKVFRHHILRPTYFVPAAEGFAAAVRAGCGGACSPRSSQSPRWPTARSYGYPMSPRRAAVLAMLDTRQPDCRPDWRSGAVSCRRTAPAPKVMSMVAILRW